MESQDKHPAPSVLPIDGEKTLAESIQVSVPTTDWASLRAEFNALKQIPKALMVRYMQAEEKIRISAEQLQY